MQRRIRLVDRERPVEVLEVAVEVDVVLVDTPQMREAVRIHRVHEQHGHACVGSKALERGIAQERDLAPGAAEALHTVRAGGEDQQVRRCRWFAQGNVDRERFAFRPAHIGMHVRRKPCAGSRRGIAKEGARIGVARTEAALRVHHRCVTRRAASRVPQAPRDSRRRAGSRHR